MSSSISIQLPLIIISMLIQLYISVWNHPRDVTELFSQCLEVLQVWMEKNWLWSTLTRLSVCGFYDLPVWWYLIINSGWGHIFTAIARAKFENCPENLFLVQEEMAVVAPQTQLYVVYQLHPVIDQVVLLTGTHALVTYSAWISDSKSVVYA